MAAESDLEKKVRDWAIRNSILCYKFTSPGRSGVPDRIFMKNGKVAFLELKAPNRYPTPMQVREIVLIKGHGVPARWSDNYDDCVDWLTDNLL